MDKKWVVYRSVPLFVCVVLFLIGCAIPSYMGGTKKIRLALEGPEQIPIQASIAPIAYSSGDFHLKWESLANLREIEQQRDHPRSIFQGFLPRKSVSVGNAWEIDREAALQLLKQLAEKPQFEMRISPGTMKIQIGNKTFRRGGDTDGLWALLRAYNDAYAEIVFRIHAEFVFEDGFFTPSQFAGRLILDRHRQELAYFKMYVPESTLNFDVNRKYPDGHTRTATGVCHIEMIAGKDVTKEITFLEEISMKQAELTLARRFYKAQEIEWVPLDEAVEKAGSLDRPIHVVSADGTFMDESC